MAQEFPLTLTIKALDKATGPLRAMAARLKGITEPFSRFGKEFGEFSKAAGLSKISDGFKGVGSAVSKTSWPSFMSRSARSLLCVVVPDPSGPSRTMNFPGMGGVYTAEKFDHNFAFTH